MKNDKIIKALKNTIRTSYSNFNTYKDDIPFFTSARAEYYNMVRACCITNYNMLVEMESQGLIDYRQLCLLDRYNDRVKWVYFYSV